MGGGGENGTFSYFSILAVIQGGVLIEALRYVGSHLRDLTKVTGIH